MEEAFKFMFEEGPRIAEACLAVVGGMRILARYTPWKWDDKCFEAVEKWAKKAVSWLPKKK